RVAEEARHPDGEAGVADAPREVRDERIDARHLAHDDDGRPAPRDEDVLRAPDEGEGAALEVVERVRLRRGALGRRHRRTLARRQDRSASAGDDVTTALGVRPGEAFGKEGAGVNESLTCRRRVDIVPVTGRSRLLPFAAAVPPRRANLSGITTSRND